MGQKQILIIEDEVDIRLALEEALTLEGYDVILAANGDEGLKCLEGATVPHLILLDMTMPVMDGVEFRKRQLSNPRHAQIPTLLMSAGTETAKQAEFMNLSGHIKKPMDIDQLMDGVEKFARA